MTVEINHNAVRVLWEGLNKRQEFRRVLYLPYMDGYTLLLVTDADGKTIDSIREQDICQVYLPEQFTEDVPPGYSWGKLDSNDR